MSNTKIAVTIYPGKVTSRLRDMKFSDFQTLQVSYAKEVLGDTVISVEDNPEHPAYNELRSLQLCASLYNE